MCEQYICSYISAIIGFRIFFKLLLKIVTQIKLIVIHNHIAIAMVNTC